MQTTVESKSLSQTFHILKYTFALVPIIAGADKFTNLLTDWEQYLNPTVVELLPISLSTFIMLVGVIEITAGIIVLKKPALGGYIVAGWLTCIALSLLIGFDFVDVAVRDLVMAISALSMARLAKIVAS